MDLRLSQKRRKGAKLGGDPNSNGGCGGKGGALTTTRSRKRTIARTRRPTGETVLMSSSMKGLRFGLGGDANAKGRFSPNLPSEDAFSSEGGGREGSAWGKRKHEHDASHLRIMGVEGIPRFPREGSMGLASEGPAKGGGRWHIIICLS